MNDSTRQRLIFLGVIGVAYGALQLSGRRGPDFSWMMVRDARTEASAPARAAVTKWMRGHFGDAAQLADLAVYQSRFDRLFDGLGGSREFRADLRVSARDSTHCRRLKLTWRDPASRGQIPEWTYSQAGREVFTCDGRRIGPVSADRPHR